MFKHSSKILKSQRGMSLVEILIALTLLGIAGGLVVSNVFQNLQEGKVQSTKIQMQRIGQILKDYRRKCGLYPSSEQGLDALLEKPTSGRECKKYPPNGFIESGNLPQDAFDGDFVYESDGRKYVLKSLGADGEDGGEDEFDKDISSEDL